MIRVTFKQIAVFVSVAKTGNMTLATSALNITQSACSMALSALESQLGGALFDRQGKKLVLNERGRMLFPKAANIITQVNDLQDLMTGSKYQELTGHLIVGASTTIGNYVLPKLIGQFITTNPKTKITLKVANTEQIIQQLLQYKIDIGLIEGNCFSDEIEVIPWKHDQLIIIAAPQFQLIKKKISINDLLKAKWILREPGSGTRRKFEEALKGKIVPFLELGNTEAIKQAVQEGIGISCLSKTAVIQSIKNKQLIELKTPFLKIKRDFYIIINMEKHKTAVLNQFIKECKKHSINEN